MGALFLFLSDKIIFRVSESKESEEQCMKIVACNFESKPELVNKKFTYLANKLIDNGVYISDMSENRFIIITSRVYTSFVTDSDKLKNRRIDKVFGPDDMNEVLHYILEEDT